MMSEPGEKVSARDVVAPANVIAAASVNTSPNRCLIAMLLQPERRWLEAIPKAAASQVARYSIVFCITAFRQLDVALQLAIGCAKIAHSSTRIGQCGHHTSSTYCHLVC